MQIVFWGFCLTNSKTTKLFLADSKTPTVIFSKIAAIHRDRIPQGFLSSLGSNFLSILYRGLASTPHSFLIFAERDGCVVGFLCCSTNTSKAYSHFLLRYGWKAVLYLLPRTIRISVLRRILDTLLYPSKKETRDLPAAEILNFCVAGSAEGSGVGRALFAEMECEFTRRGVSEIKIVSGSQQQRAHRFYERIGARIAAGMRLHGEEESVIFVYTISTSNRNARPVKGRRGRREKRACP